MLNGEAPPRRLPVPLLSVAGKLQRGNREPVPPAEIMNMLLGVLVEAVKTVSTMEREQLIADFAKNAPKTEQQHVFMLSLQYHEAPP